ncbi:MAG TPA: pyridoxal-phosphate dependent enzyme [Candidatus Thermoplasmatota archaeon]|nr:pyridoxal-phosphate dependent enzyme [Candidatus Thermoplasmatota archaeon]
MFQPAGDTLFTRVRNLESALGFKRLFLKFEGSNPTGTQKDRIAQMHYEDAHEKGFDTITLATCGNFGAAIAYACSKNGIRPAIFVPSDYHAVRVAEMEKLGAHITRVPGDYEDAVAASREAARREGWYDANPGGADQWSIARRGYGMIAREIVDALGRMPDTVAVSVGNGTTLAGVFQGFKEVMGERGLDRVPRMVAASTPRGNPVIKSFKQGSRVCLDLKPAEIRETEVNEPLTNWHSFDGDRALEALHESRGFAEYVSDAEMRRVTMMIRNVEGINVLTASTAAVAALARVATTHDLGDCHVAVLTGRRVPARRPEQPLAKAARPAEAPPS